MGYFNEYENAPQAMDVCHRMDSIKLVALPYHERRAMDEELKEDLAKALVTFENRLGLVTITLGLRISLDILNFFDNQPMYRFAVGGSMNGEIVGFGLDLSPSEPSILFKRFGTESDRFLQSWAEHLNISAALMIDSCHWSAMVQSGEPAKFRRERFELKLFHLQPDGEIDAEIFLDFDCPAQKVKIREKDPDYRMATIAAWASPLQPPHKH